MRIIIFTPRFPYPLEKGDKLRIYHQIRVLSAHAEVYLISLSHDDVPASSMTELKKYCREVHVIKLQWWAVFSQVMLGLLKGRPVSVSYFFSATARRKMHQIVSSIQADVAYFQLIRMMPYASVFNGYKVLDYMDAFSLGMKRRAKDKGSLLRPFLIWESRLLAKAESQAMEIFDNFTIISDRDRRFIQHKDRLRIEIVPNGIDPEYFVPGEEVPAFDLVFVGNLGYYPNVHAARYLVKKILPLIPNEKQYKVLLAGARPHPLVMDLQSENVSVWPWLEDIRKAYHAGCIFVAPVFQGSGLQNKILEALACGNPCITTSQVNASIRATPESHLLIADDAEQFAFKIVRILEDKAMQQNLSVSGRRFVSLHFRWNEVSVPLINILKGNIINADH